MRKVLVLADFYDLIRFQQVDARMVKQLYVAVYIFQEYWGKELVHIEVNDRSELSYQLLWEKGSLNEKFLDPYLKKNEWEDIMFSEYDFIICFHDCQIALHDYIGNLTDKTFLTKTRIFSFLNPREAKDAYIYPKLDSLFRDGGQMVLDQIFIEGRLSDFKKQIDSSFIGFDRSGQERFYFNVLSDIVDTNHALLGKHYEKILILDDYNRNFYIGDSTIWFRSVQTAILSVSSATKVTINCSSKRPFLLLKTLYGPTLGRNASFSNLAWRDINFEEYDLILFETDLMVKLLQHLRLYYPGSLFKSSIYTITPLIERHIESIFDVDFFHNHPEQGASKGAKTACKTKEIIVTDEERHAASAWLKERGVAPDDKLIIVLNGSAKDQKVVHFDVFLQFVKWMVSIPSVKVLVFDEKPGQTSHKMANELGSLAMDKVVVASGLGIRRDMAILASEYTYAIIGPCTGMLHLANGIYTYLINSHRIRLEDLPFMLVYTGKQYHDKDYTPAIWWSSSLINCAILVKNALGEKVMITLDDCPRDSATYWDISLSPKDITSDLLVEAFFSYFVGESSNQDRRKEINY